MMGWEGTHLVVRNVVSSELYCIILFYTCRRGSVVEHVLGKNVVVGSIPTVGSFTNRLLYFFLLFLRKSVELSDDWFYRCVIQCG